MAFSSGTGNSRRGGWANSLLPYSSNSTKSKLPRKSRRRVTVRDFIFANFFTIGLSISVLFFIAIVFRYGIPKPLSTPFRPRNFRQSKFRKPINRKPALLEGGNEVASAAVVDITTKDLYDKIEFLDADGGPWKQGWRVTYKGDEWDSEKLKVFVVPHSHNDPGWKLTVEEYYSRQSRHILDTIVETLSKDDRRKFIWEEMSYLERWWRDASEAKRKTFRNLVNNGQLEIVGGGWVMNDEANSHYYAIIEQMTEGNMWLNDTVGVVPKNAWAIDPFGYSPTMAYLLRRMGFENMLIQRTHYELKKELARHKNLEYIWRQSWDTEETTDIFVHMMPFYSYDIPHTCGPEPAVCCQFDFARTRGFSYELCPWGQHPVETNQDNVQERAQKLLDQYKKKSTLFRTNTLLIPLGDDFRYVSIDEAEAQFRNYQLLFDYINSNANLNTEVKFGTLEDYFQTLREEAERINYSLPGEVGSGQVAGFPSLAGDFFTYADRQQDYWSGYYVSRPFFKSVDRVLEQTLRASEMMIALLQGYCQRSQCEKFTTSFSYKLTAARRNLALFQHHDGVTGTAKDHVVVDYGTRMHLSLQDLQIFMSKAVEVLLYIRHEKSDQNPSLFEPEQVRSRYDVQPVHKIISPPEGSAQSVVFFNPLEQTRVEIVMVIVNRLDVTVLDSNWSCVESQVSPEWQHNKGKLFTGRHRLHWQASVPAMGLQTYYIANGYVGCEKAKPAKLKIFASSNDLPCPTLYPCSKLDGDMAEIKNNHLTLTFDAKLGLLHQMNNKDGSKTVVGEEIGMYTSPGSGAYLFKPDGEAQPIVQAGGQIVISEGPLMQEVYSYPKTTWDETPISYSTRIYNGEHTIQEFLIEKEYHVELLGEDFNDKELIVRFKTQLDNRRVFYSDLNGFQMSRRETYDKIPLQGNYYPMPSLAFMQSLTGQRFSVHSRQSLGVASLKNGWLEIMLDRRLVRDDGRGLGQGVMDNRPMNVLFHILIESNVSSTADPVSSPLPLNPSLLSHCVGTHLNYPMHVFTAKKPQEASMQLPPRSFSPLSASLPHDFHIVSFKVPRPLKYSHLLHGDSRFVLIIQRRQWDSAYYCQKGRPQCSIMADAPVNLFYMFKDLAVLNVKATSLNLLHHDTESLGYIEQMGDVAQEGHVIMSPMEIQAYKLELRPQQ
ncbi:alpha-mannosidase 2-like [Macadamia integrifolia]|uniref:alpha-mannosidase 2-like n=1 Tax=Macadamia integrifolia TaxID=60698 RepID=UPI001C4FB8FC|nr:alpha-mannosidase 2-like [Macadamia integrifolia]